MTAGLPTNRSESGTETHIPVLFGALLFEVEAKKARAVTIVVAAAQRRTAA